jgi:cytochrome c oxidase subunit 2
VRLHFGEFQTVVAIVFALLALGLAGLFTVIALQSRSDVPFARVQAVAYWLRRWWLGLLAALLVVVVGAALLTLPYAGGSAPGTQRVAVTGGQFYWSIRPAEIRAAAPVRFNVTSADVNHGFGIYDPGGRLVGSVQAMPGYHNKLDLTFDRPGRYRLLCLEYCGILHHEMEGTLTVAGG